MYAVLYHYTTYPRYGQHTKYFASSTQAELYANRMARRYPTFILDDIIFDRTARPIV